MSRDILLSQLHAVQCRRKLYVFNNNSSFFLLLLYFLSCFNFFRLAVKFDRKGGIAHKYFCKAGIERIALAFKSRRSERCEINNETSLIQNSWLCCCPLYTGVLCGVALELRR